MTRMYVFTSYHELENIAHYWDGPACALVMGFRPVWHDVWKAADGIVRHGVCWIGDHNGRRVRVVS